MVQCISLYPHVYWVSWQYKSFCLRVKIQNSICIHYTDLVVYQVNYMKIARN